MLFRFIKTSSCKTLFLVLFIIVSFISPLYHSHDRPYESDHFTNADNYVDEYANRDIHETFSDGHKHGNPHLHIKKDFSGPSINRGIQNKLQKASFLHTTNFFLSFLNVFDGLVRNLQKIKQEFGIVKIFSGLSPPACNLFL